MAGIGHIQVKVLIHPNPYQLVEYQTDMQRCINLGQCSHTHIADASTLAAQTLIIEYLW